MKIPKEEEIKIIQEYQNGKSGPKLANEFNREKKTIYAILRRNNINIRSMSESLRIYELNESYFEKIDSENKAYWLGFLLADGNISYSGTSKTCKQLRVTIQSKDSIHLKELKNDLQSRHPIKKIKINNHNASSLVITSQKLVKPLEENGWHEFKKHGDTKILDNIKDNLKIHLIRGLIDGDGHIGFSHHLIFEYIDLHKNVVSWLSNYIYENYNIKVPPIKNPSKAYSVRYGSEAMPFLEKIYDCKIYLGRKKGILDQIMRVYLKTHQS